MGRPSSAQKRKQKKRIRIEPGSFAQQPGFLHELLSPHMVASIQINRRQAVVAGNDQLRFADFLSQRERFAIRLVRLLKLAAALMDLRDHDERYGKVVQLSQFAIECRCGVSPPRGLPFRSDP